MLSVQNWGVYAGIIVIVPMLAVLLSMQMLQGVDAGYVTSLTWALIGYCLFIMALVYVIFRKARDGAFARGVMAGTLYGFINAALASIAEGVPILYDVLSVPPSLAGPAGLDVSNPALYMMSFVIFWVLVFSVAGRITAAHNRSNR